MEMPKISLRVKGLPQTEGFLEEETVNAENITTIIQLLESRYPRDYYRYIIFLNGVKVEDESKSLQDGDEVVVIPVLSGG